jgi:hypothetical protein
MCRHTGSAFDAGNRPKILVDSLDVSVGSMTICGPRHDDEWTRRGKPFEIHSKADCLLNSMKSTKSDTSGRKATSQG